MIGYYDPMNGAQFTKKGAVADPQNYAEKFIVAKKKTKTSGLENYGLLLINWALVGIGR